MNPAPTPPFSYCLLTGPARAAVAVFGLHGLAAAETVGQFLRTRGRPFGDSPVGRIRVGHWRSTAGEPGEEVVAVRLDTQRAEVHCHGGPAAIERIARDLAGAGGVEVDANGWADMEPRPEHQAAALKLLGEAKTERIVALLLDQFHGALDRELRLPRTLAQNQRVAEARAGLQTLLKRAELGLRLTRPFRVVLAGPPNVGKSSLANALAGFQRSIVHDLPGTTRDALITEIAVDGWPVVLVDTAGQREAADALELAGMTVAQRESASADLVLEVRDKLPLTVPDEHFHREDKPPQLLVLNKSDLLPAGEIPPPPVLAVSAKTGAGLPELLTAIVAALTPPLSTGAAVPLTEPQLRQVRDARGIA